MFSGAQNFVVNNGQFVENASGPSGIDILLQASAPAAMHDSGTRAYAPRCFPGTREQYIDDIVQWAIPTVNDSPSPLCWITGAAGVGKSAVAQTSAERMRKPGPLGASFFFSINGQNNPTTFFPSIAYQLAVRFADHREVVCEGRRSATYEKAPHVTFHKNSYTSPYAHKHYKRKLSSNCHPTPPIPSTGSVPFPASI